MKKKKRQIPLPINVLQQNAAPLFQALVPEGSSIWEHLSIIHTLTEEDSMNKRWIARCSYKPILIFHGVFAALSVLRWRKKVCGLSDPVIFSLKIHTILVWGAYLLALSHCCHFTFSLHVGSKKKQIRDGRELPLNFSQLHLERHLQEYSY